MWRPVALTADAGDVGARGVIALATDPISGNAWIVTSDRIARAGGNTVAAMDYPAELGPPIAVRATRDGALWISDGHSLARLGDDEGPVTYAKDIAAFSANNCERCHRPLGVGHPLDSFEAWRTDIDRILTDLDEMRMPQDGAPLMGGTVELDPILEIGRAPAVRRGKMKLTGFFVLVVGLALPGSVFAQVCQESDVQANLQYLRRLSLDLRGRLPSLDELNAVVASGNVEPAAIDQMLASEDLVQQMRDYHRDLLWTNVTDRQLVRNIWLLRGPGARGGTGPYYMAANARTNLYRGAQVPCLDEPASFDPDTGAILTTPDATDPTIQREGWVEVAPYWAPDTTVHVCAFDAQTAATAPDGQGRPVDCSLQINAKGCGCGPNLRWCQSLGDNTSRTILTSMNEQLLRFTDAVVREDRPYSDVILAKDMEIDGPIAFWLQNQSQTAGNLLYAGPDQNYPVPDLAFDDPSWHGVERGTRHAGVLSMPGYLVKFQSNRGRANRFYNAFLCQYFQSQNPLPPATDPCHLEPDLTQRCGCKDCHTTLEPAAGHWGRWAEAGLLPLEPAGYPKYDPTCAGVNGRNGPAICQFYFTPRDVTNPELEQPFVGMLKPYVFASPETEANIDAGPEKIAHEAIDSGAFASCTVRKMWTRFMARDPSLEEESLITALAGDFATDYSLKRLIRSIVTRPEYVSAGLYQQSAE